MDTLTQTTPIKETIRLTISTEAGLRLRVAAARRDISVGELVSELSESHLPAVPPERPASKRM